MFHLYNLKKQKWESGEVWEGDGYNSNKRATGILMMMELLFCILIMNSIILVEIVYLIPQDIASRGK